MHRHTQTTLALPEPSRRIHIDKTITKTALSAARTCGERAYRGLVLAQWRPPTSQASFAYYRAQHQVLAQIHRIWQKRGAVEESALEALWADMWVRNGGLGPPDQDGLAWLGGYVWIATRNRPVNG